MKLAIADPPYPPLRASGGYKARASRWYGTKQRSRRDAPADRHADAAMYDDVANHRALYERLRRDFDGFVIATSEDGVEAYAPLDAACRRMVWVRPNAQPGAHRIRSLFEIVIVYPPIGRRSNIGIGCVDNVLIAPVPKGFRGKKPPEWTAWVLAAMSYDPNTDSVEDLFPGSGEVTRALQDGSHG